MSRRSSSRPSGRPAARPSARPSPRSGPRPGSRSSSPQARPAAQRRGARPSARQARPAAQRPAPRPAARPFARAPIDGLLARQPWDSLRASLASAGVAPDPALELLRRYAAALLEWNRGVSNIMSRHDEERIVERHLLESIAPAAWLRSSGSRRWLDLGSGAGFPAIPLAIAGVGDAWALVESRRSKTLFLIKTLKDIGLTGFEVVNERMENVASDPGRARAYDGFTSRATMRVGPTLTLAAGLVSAGGSAFLWKGSGYQDELRHDSGWGSHWLPDEVRPVGAGPNVVARFIRK